MKIEPLDEGIRRLLFDLEHIGEVKQVTAGTHLWSDTYHIPSSAWSLPCVRCEYLHKSMWSWWTGGDKCVVWKEMYDALNCAEPIALALAIQFESDGREYVV